MLLKIYWYHYIEYFCIFFMLVSDWWSICFETISQTKCLVKFFFTTSNLQINKVKIIRPKSLLAQGSVTYSYVTHKLCHRLVFNSTKQELGIVRAKERWAKMFLVRFFFVCLFVSVKLNEDDDATLRGNKQTCRS